MSADHQHLDGNTDTDDALHRIKTAGSISISPELFEKIYLSPETKVKGDLRKTFGNPTPIALVGFLVSLTPLTFSLMNFRETQAGNGSASIGMYFFFGGVLMIVGGLLEFIVGNTFPQTVFTSFGAFWLSFGATLQPFYSSYGNYSPDPAKPWEGIDTAGFNNAFGFFLVIMGALCLIYLICSIRTNIVFFFIFFFLVPAFACLTAGFWWIAYIDGGVKPASSLTTASNLIIAGGALAFVVCMLGWWIFLAILLAALDFPFQLPVGDLSTVIKGASDKAA